MTDIANTLTASNAGYEPAGPQSEGAAPLGTLERGLYLLGLFTTERPSWTLRELREESQLAKATVRRLMLTLERLGWVEQDAAGNLTLGPRMLQSLFAKTSASVLVSEARPYLEQLAQATTESALLSVWGHEGALSLDLVTTQRHFQPFTSAGMVVRGLMTADAQVLVAFAPEVVWDARYASLSHATPHGLDVNSMRKKWRAVRDAGIAFDNEEWKPGVCAVAAPVLAADGFVLASISLVIPSERGGQQELERHAGAVREAAAALSRVHIERSHSLTTAQDPGESLA
ncbi:IclR family transcriptional regulator [Arthrobacter globiformis]|uniref:IclR family transcriptional regulator n=1 Tax=Arthrobacter globiformis TaxID=1665 RepID=UPI002790D04B|nr:IclR family transcriptional regulator [Arthrobacter globiformis]MDQ0618269.1 IclR family pca regulon transcriptional regulator [Arthrobacter globiformis]